MDALYEKGQKLKNDKNDCKKEIYEKLNYTEQKLLHLTQQMKEKIQQIVSETEEKVGSRFLTKSKLYTVSLIKPILCTG